MNEVADGVWRITGGFPLRVNAYLVRDGEGVAVFDAGIRSMGSKLRGAARTSRATAAPTTSTTRSCRCRPAF